MRYKKWSVAALSSLFLGVLLFSAFNNSKAGDQAVESPAIAETETGAVCLIGEKVKGFPFYVYKDADSGENNFSPTGNMGDFKGTEINTFCKESPYAGETCIEIDYKETLGSGYGWAGLYWQYPPNNWANIPKAYDLTGAKRLTFWARGKRGGEVINRFQVGGITGKYRDSGLASIGRVTLSKDWKKYSIDLSDMDNSIIISNENKECWPFMEPLSRIIGGFCWATSLTANDGNGITFYLDEIRFEN